MKKITLTLVLSLLICPVLYAETAQKQIAITIDDLPFVGSTHGKPGNLMREQQRFLNILNALVENKVPATGFVIGNTIEQGQWQLLQQFHDDGMIIGNHTNSHISLGSHSADTYIKDIEKADKTLTPLMEGKKFFRYPYLAMGNGEKKQKVLDYLHQNNYIVAPVTVDSKDYKYNEQLMNIYWRNRPQHLNGIKSRYLAHMWQQTERAERNDAKRYGRPMPQILLIHANVLNSHAMGDIIEMYKKHGYSFISLESALDEYKKVEADEQQLAEKKKAEETQVQ